MERITGLDGVGGAEHIETLDLEQLNRTLSQFKFPCKVTSVEGGPTVSVVTLKPDNIQQVSLLKRRERDIAFYLNVPSVRVTFQNEEGVVQLEIPNRERGIVELDDLLAGETLDAPLSFPAGVSITNEPVWYSLARMPHLLVGGSTGSGKSVFLHSLIVSLCQRYPPTEMRMVLIDPKMVEFNAYVGLPHLLDGQVHYAPDDATAQLKSVADEMRRRYKALTESQSRNIEEYRAAGHTMPYIVTVIDEVADLFGNRNEAQDTIISISQLGRAAGIHMVLATQRPSVDVVSGRLKANFPARAVFRVSTAIDSRVIIDQPGGETLLGKGDCIIRMPGLDDRRLTACFVSREEVEEIVRKCESESGSVMILQPDSDSYLNVRVIYWEDICELTPGVIDSIEARARAGEVRLLHKRLATSFISV